MLIEEDEKEEEEIKGELLETIAKEVKIIYYLLNIDTSCYLHIKFACL